LFNFPSLNNLRPNTFLANLVQRTTVRRQVGETCQYTSDCTGAVANSVCFNGTCLCNLGYKFHADGTCKPVKSCYTCPRDSCSGGTDVFCNGTCVQNFKAVSANAAKSLVKSPNWPEDYPRGQDVFFCLEAGVGRKVNLNLQWLDLETHCGAKCDYIKVYDGCVARDENLIVLLHGDNARANECMTSSCNKMLIHFHTDADETKENKRGDQRSGFMGHYKEVLSANDPSGCNHCY
jgi:hypothetical protein